MIDDETAHTIARWLEESRCAVAFTGAGISTESGIPDFRSPGGIWSKSKPVLFEEYLASPQARYEYWRQKALSHQDFSHAAPNVAHEILVKWESAGKLRGVITQNIDGLHQLAGSRQVWELHGTAREVACLECRARFDAAGYVEQFLADDRVPDCPECGGLLKHATVSFGQALPSDVIEEATRVTLEADLFLALGSSLVVYPAAGFPELTRSRGARLVIINREPTPLDGIAQIACRTSLGEALRAIDHACDETRSLRD